MNVLARFLDMDLIEPLDPPRSYLWHKINGTHLDVGGEGDLMPPGIFDGDTLALIEDWILAGAPE